MCFLLNNCVNNILIVVKRLLNNTIFFCFFIQILKIFEKMNLFIEVSLTLFYN